MADRGELPAYKIGGQFLRFRKEQIEAIRRELPSKSPKRKFKAAVKKLSKKIPVATYPEPFAEGLVDFFYFYDFYIVSGLVILLLLWFIFK